MIRDLDAALREARSVIREAQSRVRYSEWPAFFPVMEKAIARIDAALSVASGEGGAKCKICEGTGKAFNAIDMEWSACLLCGGTGVPRPHPAPSEAPNVERAIAVSKIFGAFNGVPGPSPASAIKTALDSSRAEGIAAERERCTKIANGFAAIDNRHEEIALRIRDAIREAKP